MKTVKMPKPMPAPVKEEVTLEAVMDVLMHELDSKIRCFENKKAEWLKDVANNPADAVQWGYEKISMYQYECQNATLLKNNTLSPITALLPAFANGNKVGYAEAVMTLKEQLKLAIQHFTEKVMCGAKWPAQSTSEMANYNERQKLAANALTLETLNATLRRAERIEIK